MRRANVWRGIAIGLCLMGSLSVAQAAGSIRWSRSFSSALAEAKKTDKLIMVDFYTDWCGYCKKLDAETFTDKQVIQLAGQVIPVKLDAEREGRSLAMKHRIDGFPAILFFNSSGRVENRIGGFAPAPQFVQALQQVMRQHKEFRTLQTRFKTNPQDAEAAAKLAVFSAQQEDLAGARAQLMQAEKSDPRNAKGHLGRAYNFIAKTYLEKGQGDQAMPLFRKAISTGKEPADIAAGHMGVAFCYLGQQNVKQSIASVEAALAVPNIPAPMKSGIQNLLTQLKQQKGR